MGVLGRWRVQRGRGRRGAEWARGAGAAASPRRAPAAVEPRERAARGRAAPDALPQRPEHAPPTDAKLATWRRSHGPSQPMSPRSHRRIEPLLQDLVLPCATPMWYGLNVLFNIGMKRSHALLPDVMLLTTLQYVAGAAALACAAVLAPARRAAAAAALVDGPTRRKIISASVLFLFGTLATNVSLTLLKVSFTHIVKTLEPLCTVVILRVRRGERPGGTAMLALGTTLAGVLLASVSQAGPRRTASLGRGLGTALLSNVFLQLRNVLNKELMGGDAGGRAGRDGEGYALLHVEDDGGHGGGADGDGSRADGSGDGGAAGGGAAGDGGMVRVASGVVLVLGRAAPLSPKSSKSPKESPVSQNSPAGVGAGCFLGPRLGPAELMMLSYGIALPAQTLLHVLSKAVVAVTADADADADGAPLDPSQILQFWTLATPLAFVAYQACSLMVLSCVDPLMHSVLNAIKRVTVIGIGAAATGETLPPIYAAGAITAIAGASLHPAARRADGAGSNGARARKLLRVALTATLLLVAIPSAATWTAVTMRARATRHQKEHRHRGAMQRYQPGR